MRTKTPITTPAPDLRRAHSPRTEPARPGPGPADPPRSAWLPVFGVAALFALVLLSLHLAVRLKESLGHELADRLRAASGLSAEVVAEAGSRPVRPGDPTTLQRLEEIRRATAVTDIVLYDGEGGLVGGVYEGELNPAVPPRVRIAAGATGDAAMREPERDAAGGLVVVLPMASGGSIGAVLVRLDASRDRGLAAAEFLLTLAKILGGTVAAAGVLILLRWSSRSTADSRGAPASTSDVDLVLGTMKEVMSTLKDSESEYRDRMTAAVQDAAWIRRTNDLILESIGSGLVAFDHDGRITMFNPAAEEIFATPRGRAIGRAVDSVFPEGTPMASLARDLLDRERARRRVELSMPGGDGEPRWLGISSSVLRNARGQAAGGLLLVADLTETRRLRDAAELKDRLSAIGEMSAGIAHEIKNALHSLLGYANLLRDDHAGKEPPLAVAGILEEVGSIEALVKGVLEFGKPAQLAKETVDLAVLLRQVAEAVRGPAEEAGVSVALEIDEVPAITADAEALRRAFLNLALNAVQAMEVEGGSLTLAARSADSTEEGDDLGGSVRVSVRDTGPGIPEGERRKVFTPFWTTKRDGHGLGLALVHKTVTDHGGRIQLHSRAGVGTEFVVTLPAGELA